MRRNVDHTFEQDENGGSAALDGVAQYATPSNQPRYTRRLSDKVLVAFHQACDAADLEIAQRLLVAIEIMLTRRTFHPSNDRRRSIEGLVAAHNRLWHLRQPPAS